MEHRIKDISLSDKGKKKIDWAESHMPVLLSLKKKYEESKPLKELVVGGCLHVTKETAVLTKTLAAAGATVAWSGCNPLSTNDDIAASLVRMKVYLFLQVVGYRIKNIMMIFTLF
jgi:adenosylhomocysteinase